MFKTYTLTVSSGLGAGSFSQSCELGLPLGSSEPRLTATVGRQHVPPEENTWGLRGGSCGQGSRLAPEAGRPQDLGLLSPSLQQKHFFLSLKNGRLILC